MLRVHAGNELRHYKIAEMEKSMPQPWPRRIPRSFDRVTGWVSSFLALEITFLDSQFVLGFVLERETGSNFWTLQNGDNFWPSSPAVIKPSLHSYLLGLVLSRTQSQQWNSKVLYLSEIKSLAFESKYLGTKCLAVALTTTLCALWKSPLTRPENSQRQVVLGSEGRTPS